MAIDAIIMVSDGESNAAWHGANKRRKLMLYFKTEAQRDAWEQLAADENAVRFSRWILEKAELGIHGNLTEPEVLNDYKDRIERLEDAVEYERSTANEYREQLRVQADKLHEYADKFAAIAMEKASG